MYVHPEGVTVLAYVDDLFFYGPECSVDGFVRKLATLVKFSEPTFLRNTGDSLLMLGRTVTRTSKGFLLTTDPKHCIQIVAEMCDWENRDLKQKICPGRKATALEAEVLSTPLDAAHHSCFRRNVGRLIFCSLDRPDLLYMVKLLSSDVAGPTLESWRTLVDVACYLRGRESCMLLYEVSLDKNGFPPNIVESFADSDWAGNQSRKSTSGCSVMWGNVSLGFFSRSQGSFALSSCEAELYAAISSTAEALYSVGLLAELGHLTKARVWTDSSSALSLLQRPGHSRAIRHIHTKFLYIQDLVEKKIIIVAKIGTKVNQGDLLTKIPTAEMLKDHMPRFGAFTLDAKEAARSRGVQAKRVLNPSTSGAVP